MNSSRQTNTHRSSLHWRKRGSSYTSAPSSNPGFRLLAGDLINKTSPPTLLATRRNTSPSNLLLELLVRLAATLEAPECGAGTDLAAEDVRLDPPRQYSKALVLHEGALGDGEDVVEFFEGALWTC